MKDSILVFFGENAFYCNEEEEKEAKDYLQYWKKNLLKKLTKETYHAELIEESYHVRGPEYESIISQRTSIALKLTVKIKFQCSLDQCLGVHHG